MGKYLLGAFAADDPDRFAQLLGKSADLSQTTVILNAIPDGLEGDVLARLTPESADRLLHSMPDELVTGWLSTCSTDAGRRLLSRLSRERASRLIAGINDRAKRRDLRRLIEYSPGSIGSLVNVRMTTILGATPVSEMNTTLQNSNDHSEAPIAVLRADGTVEGFLDLVKFVQNTDSGACASDFCIPVKPVYADAPLRSLLGHPEWLKFASLPVVDYERKLVGYVSHLALNEVSRSGSENGLFLETGVELSKRFLEFMGYVLTLLLDRRSQR